MSRARGFVFPLLAGLMTLVASGASTGQSLTRTPRGDHALSAPAQTAAAEPRSPSDDDTPWGFFRKNVKHANSLGKWLALIFFTTMLTYMYLLRAVLPCAIE